MPRLVTAALLGALSLTACAQAPQAPAADKPAVAKPATASTAASGSAEDRARAAIAKLNPRAKVEYVGAAPLPGFREVIAGGQLLYVSDDGRYLMQGAVLDLEGRRTVYDTKPHALRWVRIDDETARMLRAQRGELLGPIAQLGLVPLRDGSGEADEVAGLRIQHIQFGHHDTPIEVEPVARSAPAGARNRKPPAARITPVASPRVFRSTGATYASSRAAGNSAASPGAKRASSCRTIATSASGAAGAFPLMTLSATPTPRRGSAAL